MDPYRAEIREKTADLIGPLHAAKQHMLNARPLMALVELNEAIDSAQELSAALERGMEDTE